MVGWGFLSCYRVFNTTFLNDVQKFITRFKVKLAVKYFSE